MALSGSDLVCGAVSRGSRSRHMADVGRPTPVRLFKIEVMRDIRNGVRRNNYWDYDIGPDETLATDLLRAFSRV